MHLAGVIKERREALNVTQETLAGLSGVSLRTLIKLETGNGNPTLSTLEKLSEILGMELVLKVKQLTNIHEAS